MSFDDLRKRRAAQLALEEESRKKKKRSEREGDFRIKAEKEKRYRDQERFLENIRQIGLANLVDLLKNFEEATNRKWGWPNIGVMYSDNKIVNLSVETSRLQTTLNSLLDDSHILVKEHKTSKDSFPKVIHKSQMKSGNFISKWWLAEDEPYQLALDPEQRFIKSIGFGLTYHTEDWCVPPNDGTTSYYISLLITNEGIFVNRKLFFSLKEVEAELTRIVIENDFLKSN